MGIDTGKYVGYTFGGSQPTLYFDNGHYTQVHDNKENVGWHPTPAGCVCLRHNISATGIAAYSAANTPEKKETFAREVLTKTYDDAAGTLCEIFMTNFGQYAGRHLSRGRLIREDENSDAARAADIRKVRAEGVLAPNETGK